MRKFSVFLGIILFVQILYSCTSPIIPYSIDAKKEARDSDQLGGMVYH